MNTPTTNPLATHVRNVSFMHMSPFECWLEFNSEVLGNTKAEPMDREYFALSVHLIEGFQEHFDTELIDAVIQHEDMVELFSMVPVEGHEQLIRYLSLVQSQSHLEARCEDLLMKTKRVH